MNRLALALLLFLFAGLYIQAQERVSNRIQRVTRSDSKFCSPAQPNDDDRVVFADQRDVATENERDMMCYQAFVEALNALTYCYPDTKAGYVMDLDASKRDAEPLTPGWNKVCKRHEEITYGESIIPDIKQMGYKYPTFRESQIGNSTGNVHVILKWDYVEPDRFEKTYSRLEFKYEKYAATFTGCHLLVGDEDRGKRTTNPAGCQGSGDWFHFAPSGFRTETLTATIFIYPLIFENDAFYFEGGGGEWITTRQRALMMLMLHELGHLEQYITRDVQYGEKVTVGEGESHADHFAYSVVRCVP